MNQRRFLVLGLCAALAGNARLLRAQTRANLPRMGVLSFSTAPSGANPDPAEAFSPRLREFGYAEGQNILIERRYADGQPGRLPALAAELVQLKVDNILTGGPGLQAGARQLGLQLEVLEVSGPNDFDAAFSLARQHRVQTVCAIATNTVVTHRARLAALAIGERLPSISEFPLMAPAGFLLTDGADLDDLGRRAIVYLDKILKGARPGDLAIERPTKFQLIVNLKTAKALGIKLPQALLLRADEVIQ